METSDLKGVILESNVNVEASNIPCSLTLNAHELRWIPVSSENHNEVSIPISEVINVVKSVSDAQSFTIHHIERKPKHVWHSNQVSITCEDEKTRNLLVKSLILKLENPALNRPKSLLIFINPSSGGGAKTLKIYHEKVSPVFQLAGINTHVIVTERGMQAAQMLQTYDLSTIDGVICVGGDGTMTEVAESILMRTIKDHELDITKEGVTIPKTQIRLGIIPAGSFDMLCDQFTIGTRDPATAALHVVVGDDIATDTCSVQQNGKLSFFSPCLMIYGTPGDMLAFTENYILRLLGPWRYLYGMLRTTAIHRRFHAEIEYLPATRDRENTILPEERNAVRGNETMTTDPKTGYKKITGDFQFFAFHPLGMVDRKLQNLADPRPWYVQSKEYLNNGYMTVTRTRLCSRMEFLSLAHASLTKQDINEMPEYVAKCHGNDFRLKITPINGSRDLLFGCTSDGDRKLFEQTGNTLELQIKLHHACLRMFARGIEKPLGE